MNPTSYLEINLTQLAANLRAYRDLHNDTPVCAVIKADAYGLGLAPIAQTFIDNQINMLAVFSPAQAADLLTIIPPCPTLILMPTIDLPDHCDINTALANRQLHFTIHHPDQLAPLNNLAKQHNTALPIHLYIDTGMSRAGLSPENLEITIKQLPEHPNLKLAGIYTHFTSAEDDPEFTKQQHAQLHQLIIQHQKAIPADTIIHAANSYAALRDNQYTNKMLRVGLGLYGYAPQTMNPISPQTENIKPIVRWMSQIAHIDQYPVGRTVGYNRTHTLTRDSRLAMVPVGYGDGYPTSLSNLSSVRVQVPDQSLAIAPVRGRVNMDQITIDLTDLPGDITTGTPVEIYSNELTPPNALHKIAQLANHNCYELLCQLSTRIPRRYSN